jgi:hypothetical protein
MTRRTWFLSASALAALHAADSDLIPVKAKRKPADEWKIFPTRSIRQLSGFQPGAKKVATGKFGGRLDRRSGLRPGFFRVVQRKDRWWLVDPEGNLYIKAGVAAVGPGSSANNRAALKAKYGTAEKWAEATARLLHENGFTGTGAWTSIDLFASIPERVVYTPIWNFMSSFGKQKKLTFQQPGHMGYPGDCIPVFHPEFESFCDEFARQLAAAKDDPWLLGHFSDNELPAPANLLDKALQLDTSNPALAPTAEYAKKWLAAQNGSLNDQTREAFREHVFDRYFQITTAAIRKHDPNHLCLGSRLNGPALKSPGVLRAAGRYLDAVAMNVYGVWTPDAEMLELWRKETGKPFLVTEFYAKGADSGYANTTGAGWLVETQKDRALFYQNFLLGMLESKLCVGWDWFKYMDNDPEDLATDPSNRDSNKGIVSIRYEPYRELLAGMGEFNREIYPLTDYFEKG